MKGITIDSAAKKDMAILRSMKTPQRKYYCLRQILLDAIQVIKNATAMAKLTLLTTYGLVRREFPKIVPIVYA